MLNRSASLAMSTSVLKALPGKLDIKRHSPSILYICAYAVTYFTSGDMISCLPVYNYSFFLYCLVFFCLLFLRNTKKLYNIQSNTLCFHDMKNLSLRLGGIGINNSLWWTRFYAFSAKPYGLILHVVEMQCIILYKR